MANMRLPAGSNVLTTTGPQGPRGFQGPSGPAGPGGHTGPTGPAGGSPADIGSWLKFSGVCGASDGSGTTQYLADGGYNTGLAQSTPANYPVPVAHSVTNLAVSIDAPPGGGTILVVNLLRNSVLVPGFTLTFTAVSPLIQVVAAGPLPFSVGDALDIQAVGSQGVQTFNVAAMIGVGSGPP